MLVVLDGDRGGPVGEHDELAAIGGLQDLRAQALGRAERDLAPVQAEDPLPRASLADVVGRDQQRPPLPPQLLEQGLDTRGAGRVDARQRLVEQHHRRVLDQRPGDQHALALAAGELAEALARPVVEADARERREARPAVEAAIERRAAVGAHQRDVERGNREVEPRPLGLGHVGGRAGELGRAAAVRQLPEQRAEERALAATVGAEDRDDLAGLGGEAHCADRVGAPAGAAGEPLGADERGHARLLRGAEVRRWPWVVIAGAAKTAPATIAIAGPAETLTASASHSATRPSTAASAPVPSWSSRRSRATSRTVAAGTTRTTETSSAPTAASATITAAATATSSARSGPATATPSALAPSGSKARASQARRNAPCATSTTAAVAAVRSTSRSLSPISVPNNRRSTPAPER